MLKITGVIFCEILVYTLLKQYKPEFAVVTQAAGAVVLLLLLGEEIKNAINALNNYFDAGGLNAEYISVLIKVLGIALITQFSVDLCRDNGESALASKVEFAGKIIMISTSIPVLKGFVELVNRLVENV